MPFLSVFGLIANAVYFGLTLLGAVIMSKGSLEASGIIAIIAYLTLVSANSVVLASKRNRPHKALIATNVMAFGVIALLLLIFSQKPQVKLGALMQMGVGMITVLALLLASKDSWLSLYFERRRLEEKKRIASIEGEIRNTVAK
ncbi:MAG: hypothetical protein WAU88_00995 [Candidatus Zixiibacteriota bacterium]